MLRRFYANKLRRFYANKLRNHYAIITQINYADFTQINYAIITQSLRMLRSHYANKLRRFYANKLRNSLRRLRNSITQIRLRNSPKCHYADYANTDFHYAKIQFITQWATCWCTTPPLTSPYGFFFRNLPVKLPGPPAMPPGINLNRALPRGPGLPGPGPARTEPGHISPYVMAEQQCVMEMAFEWWLGWA